MSDTESITGIDDVVQLNDLESNDLSISESLILFVPKLTQEDIDKMLAVFQTISDSDLKYQELLDMISVRLITSNW